MATEPDSERSFGRCRCCLSLGFHKDIEPHRKTFHKTYNLLFATNTELTNMICTLCIGQLNDAMNFKTMVLNSEKEQLRCLNNNSDSEFVNVVQSNDGTLEKENLNAVIKQEDGEIDQVLNDNNISQKESNSDNVKDQEMDMIQNNITQKHIDNDEGSDDGNTEDNPASDTNNDDIGNHVQKAGGINNIVTCQIAVDNQIVTHEIVIDKSVQREKIYVIERNVTDIEEDGNINEIKDETVTQKDTDDNDSDATNVEDSPDSDNDDIDDQMTTQAARVHDQVIEQSTIIITQKRDENSTALNVDPLKEKDHQCTQCNCNGVNSDIPGQCK
ncbi:hypothetical protein O0L34_g11929 [Tuta absoluta]|nr:hypothetical protein O0L34_g11929 [Tuta absoluta]